MTSVPVTPLNEAAYELFDRWLEHWQRESARPLAADGWDEPAAAAAPPTQEEAASPPAASAAAAAPPGQDPGLDVLRALTEQLLGAGAPGDPEPAPAPATDPLPGTRATGERLVGGATLRFPARAATPTRPVAPSLRPVPATAEPATPGLVLFSPRPGARGALTWLGLAAGTATTTAGLTAWATPTATTVGVALALALLTGLLWHARNRATGTTVRIERGELWIQQGRSSHRFPLAGPHPPIDVVGDPHERGWKVLIQRRGRGPYVVDARMVDPVEFTEAIRRFRPGA
jgi:hypothetical protein